MIGSSTSEVAHLLPNFLKNRQRDLEVLAESMASGGFEMVGRLGHSMHGSGGTYGFKEISEIGRELEQAALLRDHDTVARNVNRLREVLSRAS